MNASLLAEIIEQVRSLPYSQQYQVLLFARTLKAWAEQGVPGKLLLQFAGAIPAEDVERIRQAIESDCEQVDQNEW